MNKNDFIKSIAEKMEVSAAQAARYYEAMTETITEGLKDAGKISLNGLGNFELKHKAARQGINPLTKQKISIAASNAPTFKFSAAYKKLFN